MWDAKFAQAAILLSPLARLKPEWLAPGRRPVRQFFLETILLPIAKEHGDIGSHEAGGIFASYSAKQVKMSCNFPSKPRLAAIVMD